jgi:G3E family GTPase
VARENPDIIAIQEVRLDTLFYTPHNDLPYWRSNNNNNHHHHHDHGNTTEEVQLKKKKKTKRDFGSQIEHFLSHFSQQLFQLQSININNSDSSTSREYHDYTPYQFVYHPAMLQHDR